MTQLRAGTARLLLEPPLGLPMVGFIRQPWNAQGYGLPLEVGALVLERGDTRVVLCGADIVGIIHPQIEPLLDRIATATGARVPGILLNLSHTHLAPPGGVAGGAVYGDVDEQTQRSIDSFSRVLHDKIVSACRLASERLEPAGVVWGQADVDLAVNRRERTVDGFNGGSILGWNPDELVDNQVTVMQVRRPGANAAETAIATLVGYGCHPVTTGYDMDVYSADFPGPMRDLVRSVTGGECIFFQGAAGNVLPKFAFTDTEEEAHRMGTRLGLAALEAVADRYSRDVSVVAEEEGSVTPITRYRRRFDEPDEAPALAAAMETVSIPLMPHPRLEEVGRLRQEYDEALEQARAAGERGPIKIAFYHASWARKVEAQLRDGTAPTEVRGPVHAVRIGDGVIVTGPGETFTEYGIAVKERSPGAPTLYAGYTNEILGYLPTAAEYAFGGYEAGYGYKSVGLPSLFDPSVERILVETGVRLAESLFPDAEPWDDADGWVARGEAPSLASTPLEHPSRAGVPAG